MKWFYIIGILLAFSKLQSSSQEDIDAFLNRFPGPTYQDLIIQNKCLRTGTDLCRVRYEMIRPILELYQGPFSLLDLGAAQGYFSFRIAEEFPQSVCVMIGANSNYYGNHGDMLYPLCLLNDHLGNIFYLNKFIDIKDLYYLSKNEHFDIVLALLVIHQIDEHLPGRIAVIEKLLQMGDNVIIEVSNDVAPDLGAYVEALSKKIDCIYLGEVRRHYNINSKATGKLFCFTNKQPRKDPNRRIGIMPDTFAKLNGVYGSSRN